MFRLFKKKKKNKIEKIEQIPINQNDEASLIRLNEKIDELRAAYSLMELRAMNNKIIEKSGEESNTGVNNLLKLLHDETTTNINFMSSNNSKNIYNELIIEFDILKAAFENLMNEVDQKQNGLDTNTSKD